VGALWCLLSLSTRRDAGAFRSTAELGWMEEGEAPGFILPLSPEITVNLVATARSEPHGVRSWRLQRDLVSPLAKSVGEARQMRQSTSQRAQGRRGQLGPRIPTTSPPSNNRGEQRERGEDHLTARGPHISVTEEQVSNRREVVRPMKQTAVTEGRGWRQWPTWKR
jgi:hypothetical protein